MLSAIAVSTSVAVYAAAPEKRTFGVAVVSPDSVTPVFRPNPVFSARLQSPVVTPALLMDKGASMISPATSARPRVTVNSTVPLGHYPATQTIQGDHYGIRRGRWWP